MHGVVLLWHGSGPREADVLGVLRGSLAERGIRCFAPDWDSTSPDHGREVLLDSLRTGLAHAHEAGLPFVLAGWSLGGTAALGFADPERPEPGFAVVGLAADVGFPSPIDRTVPNRFPPGPLGARVALAHGRQDEVVPLGPAVAFAARHPGCDLAVVDTDHAEIVGAAYDEQAHRCVPSTSPAATAGAAAALDAIADAFQH